MSDGGAPQAAGESLPPAASVAEPPAGGQPHVVHHVRLDPGSPGAHPAQQQSPHTGDNLGMSMSRAGPGRTRSGDQCSFASSTRRYSRPGVMRKSSRTEFRLQPEKLSRLRRLGWFLPQPPGEGEAEGARRKAKGRVQLTEEGFDSAFERVRSEGVPIHLYTAALELTRMVRHGWPGQNGQCALLNAVGFTHEADHHKPNFEKDLMSCALVLGWMAQQPGCGSDDMAQVAGGQLQQDVIRGCRSAQLRSLLSSRRKGRLPLGGAVVSPRGGVAVRGAQGDPEGLGRRASSHAQAGGEDGEHQPLLDKCEVSSAGTQDAPPYDAERPPPRTHIAAMYVQDAMDFQPMREYAETPEALRAHRKRLMLYYPVRLAIMFLLVLSFIASPTWCQRQRLCGSLHKYPMWPIAASVDRKWQLIYESGCIAVLGYDFWQWSMLLGVCKIWRWRMRAIHGTALLLYLADLLWAWSVPYDRFRVGTYLRPIFFIAYSSEVQRELWFLLRAARDFVKILLLMAVYLTAVAWFAVVFFPNDEPEGRAYFHELSEGMWHLQVLLTTNNAPDVWIPAYKANRWSVLIFVFYVMVGLWVFLNLFTAVIYASYTQANVSARKDMLLNQKLAIDKAFCCLVNPETPSDVDDLDIDRNLLLALFSELNQNSDVRYIDTEEANVLFGLMDNTGDWHIDKKEFRLLPLLLNLEFDEFHGADHTFLATTFPDFWRSAPMLFIRELVRGRYTRLLDGAIDIVLLTNGVLVVIETRKLIVGEVLSQQDLNDELHGWQFGLDTAFTAAYFLEMVLKLGVLGWDMYWKSLRNCFDGGVTLLAVVSSIYIALPNGYSDPTLLRWVVMGRLLRLVRLLGQVPWFEVIFTTLVRVLPDVKKVFLVLFCIVYYFSAFGMDIYGGRITLDKTSVYYQALQGGNGTDISAFAAGDWYTMNFNDMASGFGMLFACLIMNNWDSYVDAYVRVSLVNPWWSRGFFTLFWVVGALACLNILTSSIIDRFTSRTLDTTPTERVVSSGGYDELKWDDAKRMWQFESDQITGTRGTYAKHTYHVRYAGDVALLPDHLPTEEKLIRSVFTQCSVFDEIDSPHSPRSPE
eukprot:TRINITY_DN15860_c0_g1_i1.p1 TRINITY_DN15860_c0_g1~~TRINITY_DN15860_c0_g1_i1.p1  ORF type:complete len:1120 (+),score=409.81 TRINITY_DN15860_c0_g1_i1:96-3362(+)